MKIAHIANRIVPVPPTGFGGIERFLYPFLQQQVQEGDEIVLFCAEGSAIAGVEVVALAPPQMNRDFTHYLTMSVTQVGKACERIRERGDIDIIHDHTGFGGLFANTTSVPMVCSLHNGLEQALFFSKDWTTNVSYLAISESQLHILRNAGIEVADYAYYDADCRYLLEAQLQPRERKFVWMGRLNPQKAPDLAIQVALRSGYQLVLAGPEPEAQYRDWYEASVVPFIDGEQIIYAGLVGDSQKVSFFEGSTAFLMPNRCYPNDLAPVWEEPFGVVLIEAMAAGIPVLGTRGGSLPELVQDKGILVDTSNDEATISGMVEAIRQLGDFSPEGCRARARDFLPGAAARNYRALYQRALQA